MTDDSPRPSRPNPQGAMHRVRRLSHQQRQMLLTSMQVVAVLIAVLPCGAWLFDRFTVSGEAAVTDVAVYRGNGARTGEMTGPGPNGAPASRWRVGESISTAPVISGGTIFVGTVSGEVIAVDAASGAERWRRLIGQSVGLSINRRLVADASMVYAISQDGAMVALDVATGSERWRYQASSGLNEPALVDGVIYVTGGDGSVLGIDAASGTVNWTAEGFFSGPGSPPAVSEYSVAVGTYSGVVAFTRASGAFLWSFETTSDSTVNSVTFTQSHLLAASSDGNIYALDEADGEEQWRFVTGGGVYEGVALIDQTGFFESDDGRLYAVDTTTGAELWHAPYGGGSDITPGVASDTVVTFINNQLVALDTATGARRWVYDSPERTSVSRQLAIGANVVYAVLGGVLHAVDQGSGASIWSYGNPMTTAPAVVDGLVYVGSASGGLSAVDAASGKIAWTFYTEERIDSSPTVADGRVFFGSDDDQFTALDARTGQLLWQVRTGSDVDSSPVVVEQTVYIGGTDGQIYALSVADGALLWQYEIGGGITLPVAVAYGIVYATNRGVIVQLDADSGERLSQTYPDFTINSQFAVTTNSILYADSSGGLTAIDRSYDPEVIWHFGLDGESFNSNQIVVHESLMYAVTSNNTLYAISTSGGYEQWRVSLDDYLFSLSLAGDLLYAGLSSGEIHAFDATSGQEVWRYLPSSPGFSTNELVIAGAMLFSVSQDGTLTAIGGSTVPCLSGGSAATPVGPTARYVIVGAVEVRSEPLRSAQVVASLESGDQVIGIGQAIFADGTTWWPVRDERTSALGWVPEANLRPVNCAGSTFSSTGTPGTD